MLRDPIPGLRPIRNGSKDVLKPSLVVQPGDELFVSDDVAAQLLSAGFKASPVAVDAPAEADEEPPAPKRRRGQS